MSHKNKFFSPDLFIFIEQYIFQILFLFFGCKNLYEIFLSWPHAQFIIERVQRGHITTDAVLLASYLVFYLLLAVFNFLCAYSLYIRGKLIKPAEGFGEIVIPFVSTYGFLFYNIIPFIRARYNMRIIPSAFIPQALLAGILLAIGGLVIACLALFQLKRSFGVFVQVREVVTHGLYRYVRHPMYLGHTLIDVGFLLIIPRLYNVILACLLIMLRLYRGYLEEKKLAEHCADYREYMKRTPFLLPKF